MKENFSNLVKEIDMQAQEAQRVPIMMDVKRSTPRHIIVKRPQLKYKETLLNEREKKLVSEGYQMGRRGGE